MKPIFVVFFCFLLCACPAPPQFNANRVVVEPEQVESVGTGPSLVVEILKGDKLSLRDGTKPAEDVGTIDDTEKLRARVREILASRKDKTAFVKAPREILYRKVVTVIDVLKTEGARPIGAQLSDPER